MIEHILNMAHHASLQYTLMSTRFMATLGHVIELDGPSAWVSGHKPRWLVAIDYTTLITLLLVTSISAILLASAGYKSWREGVIKLDTSDQDGEKNHTRKEALVNTLLGNMDHTLHEDGDAVGEAEFWRSVRRDLRNCSG